MRHLRILVGSVVAAALALPASPAAAKPPAGCPAGFDLGALTYEETLDLPRIQAGLGAGAYDLAEHEAIFVFVDRNADGLVCFKDVATLADGAAPQSGWQYLYNVVDNNSALP